MDLTLSLCLPHDALSVPVVRKVATQSLLSVGFLDVDVDDAELAITEACGNVLRHSHVDDQYLVQVELHDATLTMEVVDAGHGFDGASLGHGPAPGSAEMGRGIQLMRAMVDDVRFSYLPGRGSVVIMTKRLRYHADSPLALMGRTSGEQRGGSR